MEEDKYNLTDAVLITANIDDLIPYENNARTHSREQIIELSDSIKTYGLINPLAVAQRDDGKYDVVAGHGRLEALKMLGVSKVPVILHQNLSADEVLRKGAILADNQIALHAGYDPKILLAELEEIAARRPELLDATGFSEDDLKNMLPDNHVSEEDEFERSGGFKVGKDIKPFTSVGEVYTLGTLKHRVMNGSSTDAMDVEKLLGGVNVDLLLTDPPYNVDIAAKDSKGREIKNDNFASEQAFQSFLAEVFGIVKQCLAPNAAFYVFYADMMTIPFWEAVRDSGLKIRQLLVWEKNAITLSWNDYQWKTEPILYGENDDEAYIEPTQRIAYGFESKSTRVWNSDRKQPNIIVSEKPKVSKLHPTMKPIKLLDYLMRNSSRPRDKVFDPFGGSGSTLICANQIGRVCYMMELDERYASTILLRFATSTNWEEPIINEDGEDVREALKQWAEDNDLLKNYK